MVLRGAVKSLPRMLVASSSKGARVGKRSLTCCVGGELHCFRRLLCSSSPWRSSLQTWKASRSKNVRNNKALYLQSVLRALDRTEVYNSSL